MRIIPFSELHTHDFCVSDIIVLPQTWHNGKSFTYSPAGKLRPDHGIMLLTSGNVKYTSDSGEALFEAAAGQMLYAPKASSYRAQFYADAAQGTDETTNILVNFLLYDENGEEIFLSDGICVIGHDNGHIPGDLRSRFEAILSGFCNVSYPPAKVKAMLYELLCDLSLLQSTERKVGERENPLKAAEDYIAENYLSCDIKIGKLANLCCMSEVNFRRVFEKHHGVSPKAYILSLKIDYARVLLKRGDFSVAEVARLVGFEDASYFVRIYKKYAGDCPGKIKKAK